MALARVFMKSTTKKKQIKKHNELKTTKGFNENGEQNKGGKHEKTSKKIRK